MAEGLPTYDHGRSLHDYLGFSVFQTELAAGDVTDAVAGLYSELAHTTSTDEGWEWDVAPFGDRASSVNLAPHGTFAGDYVALLRDMLVAEEPGGGTSSGGGSSSGHGSSPGGDSSSGGGSGSGGGSSPGGDLNLLAGASPAWLAPGQHITVTAAPTADGVISFTERSTARGETLTWKSSLAAGAALTWTLPSWATHAHTVDGPVSGSSIALHGRSGSITVAFGGDRPRQSYARAAAELNSAYRAHGRQAPLVARSG
jgi:hypothetical protein